MDPRNNDGKERKESSTLQLINDMGQKKLQPKAKVIINEFPGSGSDTSPTNSNENVMQDVKLKHRPEEESPTNSSEDVVKDVDLAKITIKSPEGSSSQEDNTANKNLTSPSTPIQRQFLSNQETPPSSPKQESPTQPRYQP